MLAHGTGQETHVLKKGDSLMTIALTVKQVAARLAATEASVYGYADRKRDPLPLYRLGETRGGLRIDEPDLEAWIQRRKEEKR